MQTAVRRLLARRGPAPALRRLGTTPPPPPAGAALRLFGYAICPFCHVVRSAARYTKTTIALTEVNPLTKAEIKFSEKHRKVPIAVFDDGSIVVESMKIVDELLRRSPPSEDFSSKSARKWAAWATNELAPTVYPNITSTYSDCRRALAYADGAFGSVDAFLIKNVGALGMALAHGKVKAKYGIDDEREALFEKLGTWEARIGDRPFRGGDAPDLADVAVHGVLGAVAGLPARDDVVEAHPKVGAWLERVEAALGGERVVAR
jgi:microsomal prostaglandin-E synthase 2